MIVAGRRAATLEAVAAARPGIHAVRLDVADPASIGAAVPAGPLAVPELNVLINNAGIMFGDHPTQPLGDAMPSGIAGANLLGPLGMISALIIHLRAVVGSHH